MGLTQAKLAGLAAIDRAYLGKVEAGSQNVTLDKVEQLAKALGVDAGVLLAGTQVPPKSTRAGTRTIILRRKQ